MDEHRLFKKDRPGRQGWGVSPGMREQQGCVKFCFGVGYRPAESRLGLIDDIVLDAYCRLLDQDEVVDDPSSDTWKKSHVCKPRSSLGS